MKKDRTGQTGAALAGHDDALVALEPAHVVVCVVADGEDMRRELADAAPAIRGHVLRRVDRQQFVRVHGHQNRARVRLQYSIYHILMFSEQ